MLNVKRIRRNIRAKYRRKCIGCNRHLHPRNFGLYEGVFGRLYLCISCAQRADEDLFVYETTINDIFLENGEEY